MITAEQFADKVGYHPRVQSLFRTAVSHSSSRRVLNAVYNKLTPRQQSTFYRYFSGLFMEHSARIASGVWKVRFAGRMALLPLDSEQPGLAWGTAVSIVGHDGEVKQTYRSILNSPQRPELFIDIGANFGTHSLLFLVHGIDTLTFEPNSSCIAYFKKLCELNEVKPNLQHVALGERHGHVDLAFPAAETWLGSTNIDTINRLAATHQLIAERVDQKRLDDYLPQALGKRTLIKIDTEGNEAAVLRGGTSLLQRVRPVIVFESRPDDDRVELFQLLKRSGYQIHALPGVWPAAGAGLRTDQFMNSTSTNFIATAREERVVPLTQRRLPPRQKSSREALLLR